MPWGAASPRVKGKKRILKKWSKSKFGLLFLCILKITNKKNYFSSDLVVYVNFAFPVHMKILNKQCNINNMLRLNVWVHRHRVFRCYKKHLFRTNVLIISRAADCQNFFRSKRVEPFLFDSRQDEGVKEKKTELERLRDSSTSKSRTRARNRTAKARPHLMWVMRKRSRKDQWARVPTVTWHLCYCPSAVYGAVTKNAGRPVLHAGSLATQ